MNEHWRQNDSEQCDNVGPSRKHGNSERSAITAPAGQAIVPHLWCGDSVYRSEFLSLCIDDCGFADVAIERKGSGVVVVQRDW